MKRAVLAVQISLAAVLVVLWLRWNPLSSDCDGHECLDFHAAMPEPPIQVEYGGCVLVTISEDDAVECIYEPGRDLRLWVTHPRVDEAEASVDGHPRAVPRYTRREEPGQGLRLRLTEEGAQQLVVEVPGVEPWSLRLRAQGRLSDDERAAHERAIETIIDLETRLNLGDLTAVKDARAAVTAMLREGLLSTAVESLLVTSYHLIDEGRADLSLTLLDEHRTLAERYPRGHAAWSIYRANVLLDRGRLVDAAMAYRRGGRYAVRMEDPGLQIDALSSYSSVLAELGYFEASAYWGAKALGLAREHGRPDDLFHTLDVVARASLRLREAGQTHEDPVPLLRERLAMYDPSRPWAVSRETAFFHLLSAELAMQDERPQVALDHLDQIDLVEATYLTVDQHAEVIDLRVQALVSQAASDPVQVRATLAELEQATNKAVSNEVRWQSWVRRGSVLEREGDLEGAQRAYEAAEEVLDRLIPLALIGVNGEVAPARRREGTQRLTSVLLAQGQSERALCVLRQAQSRVGLLARLFRRLDDETQASLRPRVDEYLQAKRRYESLLRSADELPTDERARAQRDAARLQQQLDRDALAILATRAGYRGRPRCDELSPRLPGEVLLGLYPHRGDGLLVIVQDDTGTSHRVLLDYEALARPDNADWLGSVLLDPLDERLSEASRVRVLASGEAAAIDLHALPWRGRALIEQVPVVYGLDLPPQVPHDDASGPAHALVLADALAKGTKQEALAVEGMLKEAGWEVQREGSSELSASDLRGQLATARHFHYAGHAYYDAGNDRRRARPRATAGGDEGQDPVLHLWPPYPGGAASEPSYIPMGTAGRLDVQDILMMERVPRTVVLMGCATGVHDERMAYGGFSLATAFLGAGAEAVVASTREVLGDEAAQLGRGLYAEMRAGRMVEPGTWFMRAARWARAEGLPSRALRDYRVYIP